MLGKASSLFGELSEKSSAFLRETATRWQFLGPVLTSLIPTQFDIDPAVACFDLKTSLNFANTTILDATYYANASTVTTLGTCPYPPAANISTSLCRVQFVVNTSDVSAITAEAWLPSDWNGRFLALGNGGLGGCIDYYNLAYGTSLDFAVVASDNGHDGDTGIYFHKNPEVLSDFTSRAVHTETVVGKQLIKAFYGRPHRKSYYLGCSTGGRQGTYAALHYPEDFDGIVAGAPAVDWNYLMGWKGMIARWLGAPNANTSESFIPEDLWTLVSDEILRQCDELDGVKDGVITEPDACEFRPEAIQCTSDKSSNCLTKPQVQALKRIYGPLYGTNGDLLFPRYDPGAEAAPEAFGLVFSGSIYRSTEHWMKYAIYNNTEYDFNEYGLQDIYNSNIIDPGGISAFSGDFSAFMNRGGKFLTYHGRRDELIPAGNSKRLYNLVSHTMDMPSLDSFYRLFLVPGLDHCVFGKGPVNIGQHGLALPSLNAPTHNVLLALVNWVESGVAPETITGISEDGLQERVHCRYPFKSVWNGANYHCTE